MLVTAECIKEVFDNGLVVKGRRIREPRFYCRGPVLNFDTDIKELANQTSESGFWCFQYPGHEGRNPDHQRPGRFRPAEVPEAAPVAKTEAPKKGRKMTQEQKDNLKRAQADARARKKARLEAA